MPISRLVYQKLTTSVIDTDTIYAKRVCVNTNNATGRLSIRGSKAVAITKVNTNTTLTKDHYIVLVDASSGNVTLSLPDVNTCIGREYKVLKIDGSTNVVLLNAYSGQKINNQTSIGINIPFSGIRIIGRRDGWLVVGGSSGGSGGGSPTPHFTINLVPTSITSPPNRSTNLTLTITPYNNFTGTVNLSLSGAPSGVSISPSSVNVPGSNPVVSTITLTIGNVAPNTYNIVFNAISGGIHVYANLSLTVQQYGLGSNYGYVCGGDDGSRQFSTIDRFQFPFNSGTANQVGNLSRSRNASSANNSSTYGYVCGGWGWSGSNFFSTIDRFQFPFDSGTANHVGNLSGSRNHLSANNSSTYGYVCGGWHSNGSVLFSTIDRFQFPFDSGTANYVGNLSGSRDLLSANNSSTYGYVCGGWNYSYFSTIDRFQFPFDSGTANYVGNLSGGRGVLSANNSSTYGYVCGGWHSNGNVLFSTVDRFQFPFNSGTASQVGNLSGSRGWLSANNSSIHGYVCGGWDNSSSYFSTIDRFQFPFDSGTANQVGNLSGNKAASSATDGVDFVTMFV